MKRPTRKPAAKAKSASAFVVVLVTVPSLKTGRALAQTILRQHLAACVNIIPRVESHFWWRGKLERSGELLLLIKTRKTAVNALLGCVAESHPYDTPEFLVMPIRAGSERYLKWLREETA